MTIAIPLTRGEVALIDDADAALVPGKWFCAIRGNTKYACQGRGGTGVIYMHRVLMGAEKGELVDHANRDGLDNRRGNLRWANKSTNSANSRIRANSSGYRGVHWIAAKRLWRVNMMVRGVRYHLGYFRDPEVAARAYDAAAVKHFGDYASTNFTCQKAHADEVGEAA